MTSSNTPKGSPAERRAAARDAKEGASDALSWEDKVLKRVGKHVKAIDPLSPQSPSEVNVGWEAASLEVLKQHSQASKDKKAK